MKDRMAGVDQTKRSSHILITIATQDTPQKLKKYKSIKTQIWCAIWDSKIQVSWVPQIMMSVLTKAIFRKFISTSLNRKFRIEINQFKNKAIIFRSLVLKEAGHHQVYYSLPSHLKTRTLIIKHNINLSWKWERNLRRTMWTRISIEMYRLSTMRSLTI